jgi:hypothetical protein
MNANTHPTDLNQRATWREQFATLPGLSLEQKERNLKKARALRHLEQLLREVRREHA